MFAFYLRLLFAVCGVHMWWSLRWSQLATRVTYQVARVLELLPKNSHVLRKALCCASEAVQRIAKAVNEVRVHTWCGSAALHAAQASASALRCSAGNNAFVPDIEHVNLGRLLRPTQHEAQRAFSGPCQQHPAQWAFSGPCQQHPA
eukprot:353041-Chlamydomonas_euryale.AAC.4